MKNSRTDHHLNEAMVHPAQAMEVSVVMETVLLIEILTVVVTVVMVGITPQLHKALL